MYVEACRRSNKVPGEGALPYVGRYHLLVLWPPFFRKSYTQWPRFPLQSTPNDSLFQNFNIKFQIFARLARIAFQKKFSIFSWRKRIFAQIWPNLHQMTPFLGSFHQIRPNFWNPTPNDPFFLRNPTPNAPFSFFGRHIPVTFVLECPPRNKVLERKKKEIVRKQYFFRKCQT